MPARKPNTTEFIKARKSQFHFYRAVRLYNKVGYDHYVLYKPRGITLGEMRLFHARHPESLYIRASDKILGIQEAQKAFNEKLESDVKSGNLAEVKNTLVTIMEETLTEPRSGSLEGISDTIEILSDYLTDLDVIRSLLDVSNTDYSTVIHSINVMTFALGFAVFSKFPRAITKIIGLAALLHDVGKTKVNVEILTAPRRLTDEEFRLMQQHTVIGYHILKKCRLEFKDVSRVALEHHEKLDKSGYPNGRGNISEVSQIICIIDCYEALTNDDRPYRSAMSAFDAMHLIKNDVKAGKFSRDVFESFACSLA